MLGLCFGELTRCDPTAATARFAAAATAFVANCVARFSRRIAATRGPRQRLVDDVAGTRSSLRLSSCRCARGTTRRENRPAGVVAGVSPANMEGLQRHGCIDTQKSERQRSEGKQRSEIKVRGQFLLHSYFLLSCRFVLADRSRAGGPLLGIGFTKRSVTSLRGEQWTVRWPESAPGFSRRCTSTHSCKAVAVRSGRRAAWLAPELAPAATAERAPICSMFFSVERGGTTILRALGASA